MYFSTSPVLDLRRVRVLGDRSTSVPPGEGLGSSFNTNGGTFEGSNQQRLKNIVRSNTSVLTNDQTVEPFSIVNIIYRRNIVIKFLFYSMTLYSTTGYHPCVWFKRCKIFVHCSDYTQSQVVTVFRVPSRGTTPRHRELEPAYNLSGFFEHFQVYESGVRSGQFSLRESLGS